MDVKTLSVRISSPDQVIWEGQANSVSSANLDGPFDIMPQHANFITIVENRPILIRTQKRVVEYTFPNALIYTRNNAVLVFTNI